MDGSRSKGAGLPSLPPEVGAEAGALERGLAQLDAYLAGLGQDSGWLVIFDRRPGLPPVAERLSTSVAKSPAGREITVIRA